MRTGRRKQEVSLASSDGPVLGSMRFGMPGDLCYTLHRAYPVKRNMKAPVFTWLHTHGFTSTHHCCNMWGVLYESPQQLFPHGMGDCSSKYSLTAGSLHHQRGYFIQSWCMTSREMWHTRWVSQPDPWCLQNSAGMSWIGHQNS